MFLYLIFAGIAIFMLIQGVYVLFSGEAGASDSNTLRGMPARLIGGIYLLPIPVAYINLQIFYGCLMLSGVTAEEIVNGYDISRLVIAGLTLYFLLFVIIKLSDHLFEKQKAEDERRGYIFLK